MQPYYSVAAQCRLPTQLTTHGQTWAGKITGGAAERLRAEKIAAAYKLQDACKENLEMKILEIKVVQQ